MVQFGLCSGEGNVKEGCGCVCGEVEVGGWVWRVGEKFREGLELGVDFESDLKLRLHSRWVGARLVRV